MNKPKRVKMIMRQINLKRRNAVLPVKNHDTIMMIEPAGLVQLVDPLIRVRPDHDPATGKSRPRV